MTKIGATFGKDYQLKQDVNDQKYFPLRGAQVVLRDQVVGNLGVLHPEVLDNFSLKHPVCILELNFKPIWEFYKS